MIGAIIGDIAGSRFEGWSHPNCKSKDFELFHEDCKPTDDSIMTLAVASAMLEYEGNIDALQSFASASMKVFGRQYPNAGYGGMFRKWIDSENSGPYNSYGNGSAMRTSPCAYVAKSLEEAIDIATAVAEITHNHPEGVKGAVAVTVAIYMALYGKSLAEIKTYITENYYQIDFTLDEIRPGYEFDVTCQGSVPQALGAFFESTSFEDAIRNAISIGGDSDTIGAITGSIAEAYYGVPESLRKQAMEYLDNKLKNVVFEFEYRYEEKRRDEMMDLDNLNYVQKRVYQNKINKGFNITDLNKEFCLLYGEVSEAYDAWRKQKDFGEELADVAIYLLGIAEITHTNLGEQILKKLDIIEKRKYNVLENGTHIKVDNDENIKIDFSSAAVRDYFIDGPK